MCLNKEEMKKLPILFLFLRTTLFQYPGEDEAVPWSEEGWYIWGSLSVVPSFFLIGLFFMILYYKCYHPGGSMPDKKQKASLF
jgi:hypothetical protein